MKKFNIMVFIFGFLICFSTLFLTSCDDKHMHEMQQILAVEATCETDGNIDYYHCNICNKNFRDENGEIELDEVVVKALGHNFQNKQCTKCGAYDYSKGLTYSLSSTGDYYIVSDIGSCTESFVIIPETYNDLPIKEIGENAFSSSLVSNIIMSNNITVIDKSAFEECNRLNSITFSNNLLSIGDCAFQECDKLVSIIFPNSLKSVGDNSFYGCDNLTSVQIQEGLEVLGISVFSNCNSLAEITLPNSLISLGANAFAYSSIGRITIGTGINIIEKSVFMYCSNLLTVSIPDNVKIISDNAFYNCSELLKIILGSGIEEISDNNTFYGCTRLIEIVNKSVINLQVGSRNYGGIALYAEGIITSEEDTKIKIVDNEHLMYIDGNTNYYLAYLGNSNSVVLPTTEFTYSIYRKAFEYTESLESITISNSVTEIGENAFYICYNLKEVTIGENVCKIGVGAFKYCSRINSLKFDKNGTWKISITSSIEIDENPVPDNIIKLLIETYSDYDWIKLN